MTKNQKIIAALSIVSVLVIGIGVLTYTLRDNDLDSSEDNKTEQVIQETSNSSILSDVEELVVQEKKTKDIEKGEEADPEETNSLEIEDNQTVDQEQNFVGINKEYETYTNEFFPNLELVYPKEFSLEFQEFGQYGRFDITLTNSEGSVEMILNPVSSLGFGCEQQFEGWAFSTENNGYVSHYNRQENRYSYTSTDVALCPLNKTINSGEFIEYYATIFSQDIDENIVFEILNDSNFQ